jgi:S-adenosylmethionine synthetase
LQGAVLRVDLLDSEAVTKVVCSFRPHVIVHCAAERRIDRCEKDPKSRELNVEVTRLLSRLAKQQGAWLLFISTDYLFDGTSPPYRESDTLNPLNEYGRQKRDAGMAARGEDWGCGVLRVPLLYGAVETLDESGVSAILAQLLATTENVALDNWQIRCPTLVDDVALVCRQLADNKMLHCGLSGVFHFSGPDPMTKFQMAQIMAREFGLAMGHVTAAAAKPDPLRPYNAQLDCTTLNLMGISRQTPFVKGIQCLAQWVPRKTEP